ncbi:MAG: T9SS type A sorting domain-containing protein [Ignavibacteria bacterium]|nr:T9SS type A sorting domain-containing protein [Ignavibacteria bacterium]
MKTFYLSVLVFVLSLQSINAQWQQVYGSPYIYSIHSQGSNIFSGTGYGLFVSSNNGSNWTQTSLSNNVFSMAVSGSYLIAGISNGILRSSNNGINWQTTNISGQTIRSFAVSGNNVFAGYTNGVYISTNNGGNWSSSSINFEVYALAVSGNNIFAGTYSMGAFVSGNNGANWSQTSLNNRSIRSLTASGNYIYAGTFAYGVYVSTNNGVNWTQYLPGKNIFSLSSSGSSVYAGCDSGIYVSNDNGVSWIQKNEGLGNSPSIGSTHIYNNYLFAGKESLSGIGIFRRPISELSSLSQISTEVPKLFTLEQNYPNPFNPVTNIEFSVPKSAFVRLAVFDVSGREIEILVSDKLSPGTYNADWDASKYSSGIYFYTITSKSFSETKRMILIK